MDIYTIYKATNKINGKSYIGYDSKWPKRRYEHKQDSKNSDQVFYRAIRKYGWDNFSWEILYQSKENEYTKNIMENHFICEYKTYIHFENSLGYNMTLGGEGTIGYKHSENSKMEISKQLIGKTKGKKKPPRTAEYREKMSASKKGTIPWNKGLIFKEPDKKWYNDGTNQFQITEQEVLPHFSKGKLVRKMKIVKCPHCDIKGSGGNMTRYHFDNCKFK